MPKNKKQKKIIKEAIGIIGEVSKQLYSDGSRYLIYQDGDLADEKFYELKGRGLKVKIFPVEIRIISPKK